MNWSVTTAPTRLPITVDDAKEWLSIPAQSTGWDSLLNDVIIPAAVDSVQSDANRALVSQAVTWKIDDGFNHCGVMEIPYGPLDTVTSINYLDADGVDTLLATSEYDVEPNRGPGEILRAYGVSWPTTRVTQNAVTIVYVAGAAFGSISESLLIPLRLMIGHLFENRETVVIGSVVNEMPLSYRTALHRLNLGVV